MRLDKAVSRFAYVVDRSFKKVIPDNFDVHCMFAVLGMHRIMTTMGYKAILVGGNFSSLTVAIDNSQASLQGYGSIASDGEYAHY